MDNRAFLCFVILLTVIVEMAEASEMHRLLQVAKSSLPILNQKPMRIAIVGSGYAGLACAYYGCKVADTLAIFGLEDSPGVQKSTCASTISAGLLHPLTPRGKVMYRGEEAFKESLSLLSIVQERSPTQVVFEQYPYPPVPAPPLTHRDEIQRQESRESAPHKSLKAMLRPCFKEPDLLNWRKASENNEKWVGFLSSEETKRFYDDDGNQMYAHSSGSSHREGADTKSASSLISESSCGISEDEMKSARATHAATEAQKDSANLKVLGVAVIRDAIVVNSTAYLQGLWGLIRSQSSISETEGDVLAEPLNKIERLSCISGSNNMHEDRVRSYTYEKRNITESDMEQLSKDYDIVIIAAGAGTQLMWSKEEVLPFAYVRGQNVELAKADDPNGIENRVASATEQSSLKEKFYQGQLESVLLAGEYIVPKRRLRTASYPCTSAVSSDTRADKDRSGDSGIDTSVAGDRVVDGVEGDRWQKTLLIGGTHEYAVTMTELEAPPDIEKASDLLMDKMLSMYPALKKEGWEPFRCAAGIRVVPPRNHLGRLPVAGKHPKLKNVWIMGGLGSRGLLYHALLSQLVIQEATRGEDTVELGTKKS